MTLTAALFALRWRRLQPSKRPGNDEDWSKVSFFVFVFVFFSFWFSQGHRMKDGDTSLPSGTKMCSYEDHDFLWPDVSRYQGEDAFYAHSTKCKKCYIHLQSDRMRRTRQGLPPAELPPRRSTRRDSDLPIQSRRLRNQPEDNAISAIVSPPPPKRSKAAPLGAHIQASPAPPGLREVAVGAAIGRAIATELRLYCEELESLPSAEPDLNKLRLQVHAVLLKQCKAHPDTREGAEALACWQLAEQRFTEGLEKLAELREGAGCSCGLDVPYVMGQPLPIMCVGTCGRCFHAPCVKEQLAAQGEGDEGFVCEDCENYQLICHYDAPNSSYFILEEGKEDVSSLGHILDRAGHHHALLLKETQKLNKI
jgi:hypothetical protein